MCGTVWNIGRMQGWSKESQFYSLPFGQGSITSMYLPKSHYFNWLQNLFDGQDWLHSSSVIWIPQKKTIQLPIGQVKNKLSHWPDGKIDYLAQAIRQYFLCMVKRVVSGSFLVLWMGVITKGCYTKDWKDTKQYPHHTRLHSFFSIRIYFIRIARLKFAKS